MTPKEAVKTSGRSESWLRKHECAWCGQSLWRALRHGCGAIYDRCEPAQKSFGPEAKMQRGEAAPVGNCEAPNGGGHTTADCPGAECRRTGQCQVA